MQIVTNISIFVFALSAAAHITDGLDVLLLEAGLIVEDGDAVSVHHKCQCWNETSLRWITVIISILKNKTESKEVRGSPGWMLKTNKLQTAEMSQLNTTINDQKP